MVGWLESCAKIAAMDAGKSALIHGLVMAPEDRLALQVYYQRLRAQLSVSDVTGQSHFLQLMEGYSNVHAAPVA